MIPYISQDNDSRSIVKREGIGIMYLLSWREPLIRKLPREETRWALRRKKVPELIKLIMALKQDLE